MTILAQPSSSSFDNSERRKSPSQSVLDLSSSSHEVPIEDDNYFAY